MFCNHCGHELPEGQSHCTSCNAQVTPANVSQTTESATQSPHAKYADRIKNINILRIISHGLSLLMVVGLIFLPIYKAFEKDFSAFSDFLIVIDLLKEGHNSLLTYSYLFLIFEHLFAIITVISLIIKAKKTVGDIMNADDTALLTYQEIKKTAGVAKKAGYFQKQNVYQLLGFALFDIVFARVFTGMILSYKPSLFIVAKRSMPYFSGFSWYAIILLIGLIGFIVVQIQTQKQEKELRLAILKDAQAELHHVQE